MKKSQLIKIIKEEITNELFGFGKGKNIEINSVPSIKTDGHTFSIECEIDFSTKNKVNRPSMDATNMHEQYAVMATITDLFKKWVNEWDKELYINKITVDPVGGEDDNSDGDRTANKRGRLYQAFMKKQLSKLNKKYHVRVFNDHFEISPTFTNPLDK